MKIAKSKDYLVSEFDSDELDLIDESIANFKVNGMIHEKLLDPNIKDEDLPTPEFQAQATQEIREELKKIGTKREIILPKGFLDVKGKLTANITGELKNKAALLQSLDSIFRTVVSTFNPNTGTYAALEDPILSKVFGTIVEMSGVPFSAGSLRPTGTQPMQQADVSAVAPAPAMAGATQ